MPITMSFSTYHISGANVSNETTVNSPALTFSINVGRLLASTRNGHGPLLKKPLMLGSPRNVLSTASTDFDRSSKPGTSVTIS